MMSILIYTYNTSNNKNSSVKCLSLFALVGLVGRLTLYNNRSGLLPDMCALLFIHCICIFFSFSSPPEFCPLCDFVLFEFSMCFPQKFNTLATNSDVLFSSLVVVVVVVIFGLLLLHNHVPNTIPDRIPQRGTLIRAIFHFRSHRKA